MPNKRTNKAGEMRDDMPHQPLAKRPAMLERRDKNPRDEDIYLNPRIPPNTPVMRAPTMKERAMEMFGDVTGAIADNPAVRLLSKLNKDFGGEPPPPMTMPDGTVAEWKLGSMPGGPGALKGITKMRPSTIPNEFHMANEVDELIKGMGGVPQGSVQVLDEAARPLLNASGESMASAEAMSRMRGMRDRGQKYVVRKGGTTRELIGPEAVDYNPRSGEQYGILDADGLFRLLQGR